MAEKYLELEADAGSGTPWADGAWATNAWASNAWSLGSAPTDEMRLVNTEVLPGWYILLEDNYRMTDQIEIRLPKTRVIESSAFTAQVYFFTRTTRIPSTPSTVHYRVDCDTTDSDVRGWTSVTPGNSVAVDILASDNNIIDGSNSYERKRLLVEIDRGLDTQVLQESFWTVRNLYGISEGN